jgi:aspartyl-tRNA(Asn)/glutamyl-tRNA(Gln) amidotransferase subunit C
MNKTNISHLAKLSQLKISDKELSKYNKQLEETINYFKNLKELDTNKIKPSHHVLPIKNIYFEDGILNKRKLFKKNLLKYTKLGKNGSFITNKILEK